MAGFDTMSPMDAYGYFRTPVETVWTLSASSVLVAKADVQRIYLAFHMLDGPSQGASVSTSNQASVTSGFSVIPKNSPLEFMQSTSGPLCASDWYATPLYGGGTLTVIEVFLNRWPTPRTTRRKYALRNPPRPT